MIERQVRYNSRRSARNPQCEEWFFLIINDQREIPSIESAIHRTFAPLMEEKWTYEGKYGTDGLKYKLINFDSERNPDSGWKSKIFKRVLKDRNLYQRISDSDAMEKYLESFS